jgi:lysophospholipid acyltransferase (LPLAT)-like uncharacterized protein
MESEMWNRRKGRDFVLGEAGAIYLRAIRITNRITMHPPNARAVLEQNMPCILATWHGQNYLTPLIRQPSDKVQVLVSPSDDGLMFARTLRRLGCGVIFGSGAGEMRSAILRRHGVRAFLKMKQALEDDQIVAMTADVPKEARIGGGGVIRLAKASGRPVIPLAAVSRYRRIFPKMGSYNDRMFVQFYLRSGWRSNFCREVYG